MRIRNMCVCVRFFFFSSVTPWVNTFIPFKLLTLRKQWRKFMVERISNVMRCLGSKDWFEYFFFAFEYFTMWNRYFVLNHCFYMTGSENCSTICCKKSIWNEKLGFWIVLTVLMRIFYINKLHNICSYYCWVEISESTVM